MSFVGALFAGKPDIGDNPLKLQLRTNQPRKMVIGRVGTAGDFGFHGLEGNDNRNLYRVIILAGHRCKAVNRIWAGGDLLTARNLQHGVQTEIREFRDGSRHRMWLTWYDGRDNQTADGNAIAANISPRRLRSSDRYTGLSYVLVKARFDTDSLTSLPEFIFELDGGFWYDRRKDSTAGGSGPHRHNQPSTWEFTTNPAVALDHYQLGVLGGSNNDKPLFGMHLNPWQVPFSEFQEAADTSDEVVLGVPRYAANGILSAGDSHRDNVTLLATQMASIPYDVGGRVVIRPSQVRPIKLTLTDADLVEDQPSELNITPSGTDLVNTVRGSYREPSVRYNETDYATVTNEELVGKDGRVFEHTIDFDFETNPTRAQRLANIELERQSRRDHLSETFMPIANLVEVGDWIRRDTNLRGGSVKTFEVELKRTNADLSVYLEARETDPSVVAFSNNQVIPIDLPEPLPPLERGTSVVPVGLTEVVERTGSGGSVLPFATVTFSADGEEPFENVDYFEIEYGLSNGLDGDNLGIVNGGQSILRFENNGSLTFEISGLIPGADYAQRFRTITGNIIGSWSGFTTFTSSSRMVSTQTAQLGNQTAEQILTDITTAKEQANSAFSQASNAAQVAASADQQASQLLAQFNAATEDVEQAALHAQAAQQSAQTSLDARNASQEILDRALVAETNASDDASASFSNRQAASTSQGEAFVSAQSASQSSQDADVSRASAQQFSLSAISASEDATESAAQAASSAAASIESRTAAGDFSTSAQEAASLATTRASEAGTSASQAQTERLSAEAAASVSIATALEGLPSSFENPDDFWVAINNGDRRTANGVTSISSITKIETDRGPSLNYAHVGANRRLSPRGNVAPFFVGQVLRLTVVARYNGAVLPDAFSHLVFQLVNSNSQHTSVNSKNFFYSFEEPNVWETIIVEFTNTYEGQDAAQLFPSFFVPGTSQTPLGDSIDFNQFKIEEVTQERRAEQFADAALSSSQNATASQTAAGQSATASANAASSAATARSEAIDARSAAQLAQENSEFASSQASELAGLAATSRQDAGGFAAAAALSATAANSSATAASEFAQSSDASRLAAQTSAGASEASSNSSATSATNAGEAASQASASAILAARVQNRHLNPNSNFARYETSPGIPNEWENWAGGNSSTAVAGFISPNALNQVGPVEANKGLKQTIPPGSMTQGFYILDADVVLRAGTFDGAGLYLLSQDDAGQTTQETRLSFTDDISQQGEALGQGGGVVGTRYRFTKLIELTDPSSTEFVFHAITHWNGMPGSFDIENEIDWHECGIRVATEAEIEGRQLAANVSTNSTAIALQGTQIAQTTNAANAAGASATQALTSTNRVNGLLSASGTLTTSAGGALAQVATLSVDTGEISYSNISLEADAVVFKSGGEVIWFADGEGLTMKRPIRWVGGADLTNPDTMLVKGNGFGVDGDLMEWFGPYSVNIDGTSKTNGVRAKDTQGRSYLHGVLEGGTAISVSETTNGLSEQLNDISANGNVAEATLGYSLTGQRGYFSQSDLQNATQTTGVAEVELSCRVGNGPWEVKHIINVTGTYTVSNLGPEDTGFLISESFEMHGSHTELIQTNAALAYDWRVRVLSEEETPNQLTYTRALSVSLFEPPS